MAASVPGICGMSITPFNAGGTLDEGAFRAHVTFMAAGGVGIYVGSYGSGEGHLLRQHEIDRLYEIAVQELEGKVPVYAAALGFSETDHVIEQSLRAAAIGVDAVQIHPPRPGPSAIRPTAAELDRYYGDILETVRTPVMLTNQMAMVGQEVPIDLIARLVGTYDHIIGINNTHPDISYLVRLIDAVGAKAPVSVGMIGQLITTLSLGGLGSLCFEPNVAPKLCASVVQAYAAGEYAKALGAFNAVLHLHTVLMRYQNPRSLKAALKVLGLPSGELRRPYLPVSEDAQRDIAETLEALNIREIEGLA